MSVWLRGVVPALAALPCAVLAAFILTDPPGGRWAVHASDRDLDRWLDAQPTGLAIGVVVTVAACALVQRNGSRRFAWSAVAVGAAVLAGVRAAVPEVAGVDALIALHAVKSVAAGVVLGAGGAAVWGHALAQRALAVGVVGGFLSVSVISAPTVRESTSTLGEPAWWLIVVTIVAALAAAVVATPASRVQRVTAAQARSALVTVVVIAAANRLLIAWIGDGGTRLHQWIVVAVAIVVVLVATEVCARRIGGPDGALVLVTTGVAAAAMPVLVDLRSPFRDVPAWSAVAVAGVAVVAGLVLAVRRAMPVAGLAVAAAVPVVGAIWPDLGGDGPWLLARLAVVGVGAGWAVGSALPGSAAVAAAGLAIPFVSLVFHAAATVIDPENSTVFVYDGAYQPLPGVKTLTLAIDPELDPAGGLFGRAVLDYPRFDDRIAGIVLTVAVVFCAWGVRGLRRAER